MAASPRILALSTLALAAACRWTNDRELTECYPDCHPDTGALEDAALKADAAGGGQDTGAEGREDPDTGVADAPHEDGGTELEVLEAIEVTAHQITWRWSRERVPAGVVAYRLRWATGADQVDAAEPWDQSDDPNLAYRTSPLGPGVVERTRALDLMPATTYHAKLYGVREGGDELAIAQGSGTTLHELGESLSLFDEELGVEVGLEGFRDPATAAQAYRGTDALWFESQAVTAASVSNLGAAIPEGLSADWSDAYLELFVRVAPAHGIGFVQVSLRGGAGEPDPLYSYFALSGGDAWQRLEVPVDFYSASPFGDAIDGFGIRAAAWGDAATIFVDAVAIRY